MTLGFPSGSKNFCKLLCVSCEVLVLKPFWLSLQVVVAHARRFLFAPCKDVVSCRAEVAVCSNLPTGIKILRGNRPPAEQWPRVQKQTTVVSPELKGRWRNGAPNTPKFQASRRASRPLYHRWEDSGARVELEAALTRVRAQFFPSLECPTVPVAREEAKLKVTRLEKALEAMGDSSGAEVDCLQRALAKAQEAAWERPLEVQIKECREFINRAEHRVAKLEQQSQVPSPVVPSSRVAELEQQSTPWCRSAMHSEPLPSQRRREVQCPLDLHRARQRHTRC